VQRRGGKGINVPTLRSNSQPGTITPLTGEREHMKKTYIGLVTLLGMSRSREESPDHRGGRGNEIHLVKGRPIRGCAVEGRQG